MTKGSGLTKLQYGMSGINVHFLFLIRPKEIKVRCGQRRQSNCGLQSHAEKKEMIISVFIPSCTAVADGCGVRLKSTTN